MARMLTCRICHKKFNAEKIQAFKIGDRKYIHYSCRTDEEGELVPLKEEKPKEIKEPKKEEAEPEKETKELTDRQKILEYITDIYGQENISYGSVQKMLNRYQNDYGYTDSGMLNTLKYVFEVKDQHPSIAENSSGVGVIPYSYGAAYRYFYSIWEAKQKNELKEVKRYVPQDEVVTIPVPQAHIYKKKKFSFLDEEE